MDRITDRCLDFTRDHIEALIMHLPMAEGTGWAYRGIWPRLIASWLSSDHGDGSVVPPCRVRDPLARIVRCFRSLGGKTDGAVGEVEPFHLAGSRLAVFDCDVGLEDCGPVTAP